ncbi:uncharacterized protein LOC144119863 [Amblyomma americanum]
MTRPLAVWMRDTLKTACRLNSRPVASAWYSQQSNPEDWDSVSGDLLSIHAKLERKHPLPKKQRPPPKFVKKHRESTTHQQPKTCLGDERVFGLHPVLLALRAHRRILYELYISEKKLLNSERLEHSPLLLEILDAAKEQELTISKCSQDRLEKLCGGGNHQASNEGQGMQPEVSALCDSIICVAPVRGQESPIGSLNVSVAAGIVLHHLSLSRRS